MFLALVDRGVYKFIIINQRSDRSNPGLIIPFKATIIFFLGSLISLLVLGGCRLKQDPLDFNYRLISGMIPLNPMPAQLTSTKGCIFVSLEFQGTGDENDKVKLKQKNNRLIIKLINSDFRSSKLLVGYQFTGEICGLKQGEYEVLVQDSHDSELLFGSISLEAND